MSYPRETVWFQPRGLMADLPSYSVPDEYLTGAENVVFRNGHVERIKGNRSAYATVQDDVLNLINTQVGSTNYWVYHGSDQSYVASPSGHTDITLLAGLTAVGAAHEWSSCSLNGVICSNNGIEAPMYWDGVPANAMQALTGWLASSSCKKLLAHRYHLFALDMTESSVNYPMRVRWSDAAAPGTIPSTWTPAGGNEAGFFELSEDDSPVLTGATLGDSLALYKRDSVHIAEYVQGQNIYANRPLFSSFGALTRRAVAALPRGHFVVGDGDMFRVTGSGFEPVGLAKARRLLFDNLDQDNYEMLFTVYNQTRRETWVCYPTVGNSFCNKALIFDENFREFGARDLANVSCAATGVVNDTAPSQIVDSITDIVDTVSARVDGVNYSLASKSLLLGIPGTPEFELADQDDVTSVAAKVERHDLTFGDSARIKMVNRMHIDAQSYGTLYAKMGSRMKPNGPITWSPEQTITSPESTVDGFAQGKYICYEIRSADQNAWSLSRVGLDAELRGYA